MVSAADWKLLQIPLGWTIFLAVLLVGLLVLVYVLMQRRRKQFAIRFTNLRLLDKVAPRRSRWYRHVPPTALLLTLLIALVAAAKPAYAVKVPRERATVILAMDISPSMLSGDVKPNRLAAAKVAAKNFLDTVPPKINVGLVAFSRSGNVKVPPTTDRAAMATGIDDLKVDKYTAIGEGIFASLDAVKLAPKPKSDSDKRVPAAVILMSDGESTVGRSNQEAASAAKQQKVPVSTIAFGTRQGTVTIAPNPYPQTVPPDPDALRMIADQTKGKFYQADDADQLKKVYRDLGSSIGYVKSYRQTTARWAVAALIGLVVSAALGLAFTSRFP